MPRKDARPNTAEKPPRKKPGPKPKSLSERKLKVTAPITRIERSYTEATRVNVLLFLTRHIVLRISQPGNQIYHEEASSQLPEGYRRPFICEASSYFKIPSTTVSRWWKNKDRILGITATSSQTHIQPDDTDDLTLVYLGTVPVEGKEPLIVKSEPQDG